MKTAKIKQNKEMVVIVISTVLPGTIRREILPNLSTYIKLYGYKNKFIEIIPRFENPLQVCSFVLVCYTPVAGLNQSGAR